jgi:hypothetical protein
MRIRLCELDIFPGTVPTEVLHDNQGSIAWAQGGLRKLKHVELKYHHTQHLIESRQIRIANVESAINAADVINKAPSGQSFQRALEMLSIA